MLFTWASLSALAVVVATSLRVTCPRLGRRTVAWWSLLLLAPIGMLDPPRETLLLGQINMFRGADPQGTGPLTARTGPTPPAR